MVCLCTVTISPRVSPAPSRFTCSAGESVSRRGRKSTPSRLLVSRCCRAMLTFDGSACGILVWSAMACRANVKREGSDHSQSEGWSHSVGIITAWTDGFPPSVPAISRRHFLSQTWKLPLFPRNSIRYSRTWKDGGNSLLFFHVSYCQCESSRNNAAESAEDEEDSFSVFLWWFK